MSPHISLCVSVVNQESTFVAAEENEDGLRTPPRRIGNAVTNNSSRKRAHEPDEDGEGQERNGEDGELGEPPTPTAGDDSPPDTKKRRLIRPKD